MNYSARSLLDPLCERKGTFVFDWVVGDIEDLDISLAIEGQFVADLHDRLLDNEAAGKSQLLDGAIVLESVCNSHYSF